jgi:peptide/nickel transport system substrate-binding protein
LPFASVLPSSASHREAVQRPVPATGPYRIASVVPRRTVRLVRNPRFEEWSSVAQPSGFPDEIVIRFVASEDRGRVAAVGAGRADLTSTDPLVVPPTLRPQVRRHPLPFMFGLLLNTTKPPLDDVRVRRAINFAIDRNKVIQLVGQDAAPTCQVLPPNFPGYRPYCPYTLDASAEGKWAAPDLAKALNLVAASGTRGSSVTIWVALDFRRVGRYVEGLLDSLGYDARLRLFERFEAVIPRAPQMMWSSWFPDYPTADNFIQALFACGSAVNFGHFCDRGFDRRSARALKVQQSDPAAANRLWANLDREITDDAAWVPAYNLYGADVVSRRIGNYQFNPQYGAILSQMWVR